MRQLLRGLVAHDAATRPDHDDARLRGRAYAVPFAEVWRAAAETAAALPRWTVTEADPRAGVLRAEARRLLRGLPDDVEVRVWLDEDARTRVDAASASRGRAGDLGANARRIARFLHALDGRLGRRGP